MGDGCARLHQQVFAANVLMVNTSFLPVLSRQDIASAAQLIKQGYAPTGKLDPQQQQQIQNELLEITKRPEAWGLIVPLLSDPEWDEPSGSVRFFGAHVAQIKVSRDWESFPEEHQQDLRDVMLDLTGRSIASGASKIVIRKLFTTLNSIALKLAIRHGPSGAASKWPDWINHTVATLTTVYNVSTGMCLDFLTIVAEEIGRADLLKDSKAQLTQVMIDFSPTVVQVAVQSMTRPGVSSGELESAMKCLEAWIIWGLPANDLTPLIPILINLLRPTPQSSDTFILASDVLQVILCESSLKEGMGVRTVTIPLLDWVSLFGAGIWEAGIQGGFVDPTAHSLLKLLVALGEHSTAYIAEYLARPHVEAFLRLILYGTSVDGYYGVDEEESEMTLGFWFKLQEEIWNVDWNNGNRSEGVTEAKSDVADYGDEENPTAAGSTNGGLGAGETEEKAFRLAKDLYKQLIAILKVKVQWPPRAVKTGEWMKDQRQKFMVYRRDVGDTLINAFYILRDELLEYFVDSLVNELATRQPNDPWESIEATLHCICSVQEAVPILDNPHLAKLFSNEILSRLPSSGTDTVRHTTLSLIAAYSTWFPSQDSSFLLGVIGYVVQAIREPALCLPAANALRDLCDANRSKLTDQMASFGLLYGEIGNIPDSERPKVVQSIASVVEALQPEDGIQPIEAIVTPIVARAFEAINMASQLPEEARTLCLFQLEAITGCARGLTKSTESMFVLDEITPQETEVMDAARRDPRIVKVHDDILGIIRGVMGVWNRDIVVCDAISELLKSITSLAADTTLLTLPPTPLLQLVCAAVQADVNAIWLSLAGRMILQMNPPSFSTLKAKPTEQNIQVVVSVLPGLIGATLGVLGQKGGMESNPDIVKAFFECMDMITQNFLTSLFLIPPEVFHGTMDCAITALAAQERYSLVKSCSFLNTLLRAVLDDADFEPQASMLTSMYGEKIVEGIIAGIAGIAPRSALQNLVELLAGLVSKRRQEAKAWVQGALFSPTFVATKADAAAKKKFYDAVISSRSTKKTREAAQQFALVARGLEGSSFGYTSAVA